MLLSLFHSCHPGGALQYEKKTLSQTEFTGFSWKILTRLHKRVLLQLKLLLEPILQVHCRWIARDCEISVGAKVNLALGGLGQELAVQIGVLLRNVRRDIGAHPCRDVPAELLLEPVVEENLEDWVDNPR